MKFGCGRRIQPVTTESGGSAMRCHVLQPQLKNNAVENQVLKNAFTQLQDFTAQISSAKRLKTLSIELSLPPTVSAEL